MGDTQYHRFITVFSPEGRLQQVEHAHKAVKLAEVTSIAAKSRHGVVVAVQKKVPDKLVDPRTVTHMFRITAHVGACLVGVLHDVLFLHQNAAWSAVQFQEKNGFEIPVSVLAQEISALHQRASQYQGFRPLAVAAIVFGFDAAADGFALFRVEPSGFCSGFRAVAAGVKDTEAMSALEKKYREFDSLKETEEFVLSTLQTVIGVDFEPADVEVALVTRDNRAFRLLPLPDVDAVLKAVAEKD
jgi:20S proteasome subunit alpha 1